MSKGITVSRRRVLQMGVLAPLTAMAARGASAGDIAAAAQKCASIPDGDMTILKGLGTDFCSKNQCKGYDEDNFATIACILWTYFSKGAEHLGAVVPTGVNLTALLKQAYAAENQKHERSGDLIAMRSGNWAIDYEHVTNYCAFRCGLHAAAIVKPKNPVTEAAYLAAFTTTENEMIDMLKKARGSADPPAIRGGGC